MSNLTVGASLVATLVIIAFALRGPFGGKVRLVLGIGSLVLYVGLPVLLLRSGVGSFPSNGSEFVVCLAALIFYAPLMLAASVYAVFTGQAKLGLMIGAVSLLALYPWKYLLKTGRRLARKPPERKPEQSACPFAGEVVAMKETTALGMPWIRGDAVFVIHYDWTVSTARDSSFGWIDRDGGIHHGRPVGGVDPDARLLSPKIARIDGPNCYVGSEKLGDFLRR